jgi:hypothetical protein
MSIDEETALRARVAQLAAEGREPERDAAAWQLAEPCMRGPAGFNPFRWPSEARVRRLRYPEIEAS